MDRALAFSEKIVSGSYERPVGNSEILSCQRFLNDLERQGTPEFPFVYDEKRAKDLIDFSETLTLAEGEEPLPFRAADFQAFTFSNWNGWVIKDTNHRRFRTSYIQIGRQNGKSVMNAVPALYYGNFAGYKYPQIYCVATKELQAKIVLKECGKFIKADRELEGTKLHPGLFTIQDYWYQDFHWHRRNGKERILLVSERKLSDGCRRCKVRWSENRPAEFGADLPPGEYHSQIYHAGRKKEISEARDRRHGGNGLHGSHAGEVVQSGCNAGNHVYHHTVSEKNN